MFFDGWDDLVRVVSLGVLAYAALLLTIRLSGKRTLASLNAFDLVVTVALGSTLATILLSSEVSFSEGVTAIVVLVVAQLVVALTSTRWAAARSAIKSRPVLLVRDGTVLQESLVRQRVTEGEIRQVVRANGSGDLHDVAAVVLETDGTFSVIRNDAVGDGSALVDVDDDDAADDDAADDDPAGARP